MAVTAAIAAWNFAHDQPLLAIAGYDGAQIALITLITNTVQIALLAAIVRWRAGVPAVDYLALTRFRLRDFLVGFLAIAAFAAVSAMRSAPLLVRRCGAGIPVRRYR